MLITLLKQLPEQRVFMLWLTSTSWRLPSCHACSGHVSHWLAGYGRWGQMPPVAQLSTEMPEEETNLQFTLSVQFWQQKCIYTYQCRQPHLIYYSLPSH